MDELADCGEVALNKMMAMTKESCADCFEVLRRLWRDGIVKDDNGIYKIVSNDDAQEYYDLISEQLEVSQRVFNARAKNLSQEEYEVLEKIYNGISLLPGDNGICDILLDRRLCYEWGDKVYCELSVKQLNSAKIIASSQSDKKTSEPTASEPEPEYPTLKIPESEPKKRPTLDEAVRRYQQQNKPIITSSPKKEEPPEPKKPTATKCDVKFVSFTSVGRYKATVTSKVTLEKVILKIINGMLPNEQIECLTPALCADMYSDKTISLERYMLAHLHGTVDGKDIDLGVLTWAKGLKSQIDGLTAGKNASDIYIEITEYDEIEEELKCGFYALTFQLYDEVNSLVGECDFNVVMNTDTDDAVGVALLNLYREVDESLKKEVDAVYNLIMDEDTMNTYCPEFVKRDSFFNEEVVPLDWYKKLNDQMQYAVEDSAQTGNKVIIRLIHKDAKEKDYIKQQFNNDRYAIAVELFSQNNETCLHRKEVLFHRDTVVADVIKYALHMAMQEDDSASNELIFAYGFASNVSNRGDYEVYSYCQTDDGYEKLNPLNLNKTLFEELSGDIIETFETGYRAIIRLTKK